MLDTAISIGSVVLKNRLVMPPMETARAEQGRVTEEMIEYYRDRARFSRPGLIILEHAFISPAGRECAVQLSIADDDSIEGIRRLTAAIHAAGSAVFAQISHAGSAAEPAEPGQNVSASAVLSPTKPKTGLPREMTVGEIRETETAFARAAVRAVEAGCDGVELHSAHSYLLNQFYSPLTNRRTDAYGPQTMENRLRFHLETIKAVRDAVGPNLPIAVRLGGADYLPDGATEADAAEACRLLEAAGVDLLDLSGGMCSFRRPGHTEPGYFASMSAAVKAAGIRAPILLAGGVQTLADAEALLAGKKADLIGVGRALFRDAHWAERI